MDAIPPAKTRLLIVGGAVALLAGLGIAGLLARGGDDETPAPPPASQAGLIIDTTQQDDGRVDRTRKLRCFVNGQMIGDLPLVECAKRNGVATDALDVGLDETGALAATGQAGMTITPLPPPAQPAAAAVPAAGPVGACWRYTEGKWNPLPGDVALNACVQTLFAGKCEKPGGATYGRWGQQTLRLIPGKVEISSDNHSFRLLAEQTAACAVPPVG